VFPITSDANSIHLFMYLMCMSIINLKIRIVNLNQKDHYVNKIY